MFAFIFGSQMSDALDFLYSKCDFKEQIWIQNRLGQPSSKITFFQHNQFTIAILLRHGSHYEYPAHLIPFSSNILALKQLGVKKIWGFGTSCSLSRELNLGEVGIVREFDTLFACHNRVTAGSIFKNSIYYSLHNFDKNSFCKITNTYLQSTYFKDVKLLKYALINGPFNVTNSQSNELLNRGCDVIGMTLGYEAMAATGFEITYCPITFISDKMEDEKYISCWESMPEHINTFLDNFLKIFCKKNVLTCIKDDVPLKIPTTFPFHQYPV
jgi:5'-methylthioadenosine phosphorylase